MNAIVAGNGLGLFNGGIQDLGLTGGSLGQAGSRYYVNGATGNLMIQRQDQVLVGHGQDTALVRTYNSQGQLDADNWYFRFEQTIKDEDLGNQVTRVTSDGFEQVFFYDAGGANIYISTDGSGAHDTLQRGNDDEWIYTEGSSQNREYYVINNGGYRLARAQDAQGYVTHYRYDGNGRIYQIIDASDQVTEFEYSGTTITVRTYRAQLDGAGNVLAELTDGAKLLRYDYDAEGRLSRVTVDLTPYEQSDDNTYVTEYQYVTGTKLISEIREWQGSTPSTQASIKFRYNDWTNAADARIRQIIVGQGNEALVTDYRYRTESGQSVVEARQFLQYQLTGETYNPLRTAITTYAFDADGRLISVKTPSTQDAGIHYTSQYSYDGKGNLVFVKDNDNRVSRFYYDGSGNLVSTLDGEGNYVKYVYNEASNLLVAEHRYTNIDVDINDGLTPSDSTAAPETTRYFYDAQKRLRFVVNAKGQVVETRYAQYGQSGEVSDQELIDADTDTQNDFSSAAYKTGRKTSTYQYLKTLDIEDLQGVSTLAAIRELVARADKGLSTAEAKLTETLYDFRGQVATIIQYDGANSVQQHFVYDDQGRLIKTIDGRGQRHETNDSVSPALNIRLRFQTLYVYDGLGRLVATAVADIDNDGDQSSVNSLATNALNDASREAIILNNTNETRFHTFSTYAFEGGHYVVTTRNEAGLQQVQTYNSSGLLIQQTQTDLNKAQTSDNVDDTYYHYDSAGRLRMTIDAQRVRTHNLYNDRGLLVGTVDGSGALTEYEYNGSGQLVRTIAYANYLGISQLIQLAAEDTSAMNRGGFKPLQVSVANIRPNFSADDRVTHNLYDDAGRLVYSIDGEGYVTEYQYDGKGQLTNTIRHSTPYEGYDYVSEDGIAVRNIDNAAIEAFARYEYNAGRYHVRTTTWEQLPREVTGTVSATHSITRELVTDADVDSTLVYVPHGYSVIGGTYVNPSHTFTVQSLGNIVGQATWVSSFERTSVNDQPVNNLNPEHYGFVAFSGNYFGRVDTGGVDVVDQPYFKVVDGVAELTPYNVLYEGDVNWLGQGNARDRTIFSGTRQYDRASENGVTFEFEISQDVIDDNGQQVLLGFGDEKGNQFGLRLSEEYSYLDNRAEDAFYQMTSFTRQPGEIYKVTVTIKDSTAKFNYSRKTVSVDENGIEKTVYIPINSAWPTTYTLGEAWDGSEAFHSVIEIAGSVSAGDIAADAQDPSTSTTVTKLYGVKEQGALLSAPFRNVIDGTGYEAFEIDHGFDMAQTSPVPHNWGFSTTEGEKIGESPRFSIVQKSRPTINDPGHTQAELLVRSMNDPALSTSEVRKLYGESEFLRNPSLPVSFKYYFSGNVDTSSSRFFIGVTDELGNQYGELLTYNDIIAAKGISGATYAQIETARLSTDTSYLEFELVSGKFQVYYVKNVLFDENGEELLVDGVKYSQAHKVLVDEFSIGDWGQRVRSVIEVRDQSGSAVKELNIRSLVESGTRDWDQTRYGQSNETTPGITLENIIPLKASEQDEGFYLQDISGVEAALYRANSDGSRGELVRRTATIINPDTYNGEVEIFKGNLEDLDSGRYMVYVTVSFSSGEPSEVLSPVYYVHNSYAVLDRHVTGAALDNFFTSDGAGNPFGLSIDQIVSQYQSLRVRIKGQDTGYFDTIDTDLGAPELYTGYLLLSDQQALADDIYDIDIEGVSRGGGSIVTLGETRLQVGERYQYDHRLNFTLGGVGQPIVTGSDITVRYWRTGAGGASTEEQPLTLALPAANPDGTYDIQVEFADLVKGSYEFTVEYLQQDTNGLPRNDFSTLSGQFSVGNQQAGSVSQSLVHKYLDADIKESTSGISISDYLTLTNANGVEFALENLSPSISKGAIKHLIATVVDLSNNSVVSRVVTDRSSLPEGAKDTLMLVKDNALLRGNYRVDVEALIDDGVIPPHQRTLNGFALTIDNNPLVNGSQNNQTTRMVWDGEPGKNVKLTFGDADSEHYVEIDITNPPGGGAPTATVTNKIHPDNALGNTVVKGITPGIDFGTNTLALGGIHTQVQSYTSSGRHVNAGLTHTLNSPYRNESVQIASEITAGNINLTWEAKTHVQDFSEGAGEFNLNPNNLTDDNQIHAILDDGQLLLRNTGSDTKYVVDSEHYYTNASPALFSVEFNVGRAAYNGFIGISNGTVPIGLEINENRELSLNGNTLVASAVANTSYRLDIEVHNGQANLRLIDSNDVLVGSQTIGISAEDWSSYRLQFGVSGNQSRIGNPLIINRVTSSGVQTGQQTLVELQQAGETAWNAIAPQNITLQQENGRLVYHAQINTAGLTDQELAVRITDATASGAALRQGEFITLVADGAVASHTTAFSTLQDKSVQTTGTAVANFFARNEVFGYAITHIYDTGNNLIDTVTTWQDTEAYARELILNHREKLENGTYRLEVQKYSSSGNTIDGVIIRNYTISDDRGTATQNIAWTLPEGSTLDLSNVVFSYRVSGSSQAYQANPITYDAQTGMFTSTLTLGQGVEVDFLVSEVDDSNSLLKSFNGKFIMGQSSGTYIEGALAIKDVLAESELTIEVNDAPVSSTLPLLNMVRFNGDLLIGTESTGLADGAYYVAYDFDEELSDDATGITHIIGGIPGASGSPLQAIEKFDTYTFNIQIDITSETGAVQSKEVLIELAKNLSESIFDVSDLNSGRYAFGVEYKEDAGYRKQKNTVLNNIASQSVDVGDVKRFFLSSQTVDLQSKFIDTEIENGEPSGFVYGKRYERSIESLSESIEFDVVYDERLSSEFTFSGESNEKIYFNLSEGQYDPSVIGGEGAFFDPRESHSLYFISQHQLNGQDLAAAMPGAGYSLSSNIVFSFSNGNPEFLFAGGGYTSSIEDNHGTLLNPFAGLTVIGWDYSRNNLPLMDQLQAYPMEATDHYSNVDSAGRIDFEKTLSFSSDGGIKYAYDLETNYILADGRSSSLLGLGPGTHLRDAVSQESDLVEGNYYLYRVGVDVATIYWYWGGYSDLEFFLSGPRVNAESESKTWDYAIDFSTLNQVGQFGFHNNIEIALHDESLPKNTTLTNIYYQRPSNVAAGDYQNYKRATVLQGASGSTNYRFDDYNGNVGDNLDIVLELRDQNGIFQYVDGSYEIDRDSGIPKIFVNYTRDASVSSLVVDAEQGEARSVSYKLSSKQLADLQISEENIPKAIAIDLYPIIDNPTVNYFPIDIGWNYFENPNYEFHLDNPNITAVSEIEDFESWLNEPLINVMPAFSAESIAETRASIENHFGKTIEEQMLDHEQNMLNLISAIEGATLQADIDSAIEQYKGYQVEWLIMWSVAMLNPDGTFKNHFRNATLIAIYDHGYSVVRQPVSFGSPDKDRTPVMHLDITLTDQEEAFVYYEVPGGIQQWGVAKGVLGSNGTYQFTLSDLTELRSSLPESALYEIKIFIQNKESGKELASAEGLITLDYDQSEPSSIQLDFTRRLNGRETRNFYDINGQLQAVLHPDGAFEEYVYDGANQLISTIRYGIRIEDEQTRANGSFARIKEIVAPVGQSSEENRYSFTFYDMAGRVVAQADSDRYVTQYEYINTTALLDHTIRHAERINAENWALLTGDASRAIGVNWATIQTWLEPATVVADQVTRFTYSDQGAKLSQTDVTRGIEAQWQYDAMGRVTETITGIDVRGGGEDLAEARSHEITYDAKGRVDQELIGNQNWTYQYNNNGQRISATQHSDEEDQPNRTSRYFYDADGRLVFTLDDLNQLNEIRYNAFGDVASTVAYANFVTQQNLGVNPSALEGGLLSANLLAKLRNIDRVGVNTLHEDHSATLNLYNRRGELRISVDAEGNRMDYQYNAFGEVWREIRHARGGSLDSSEIVNQFTYDKAGRLVTTTKDVLGKQQRTGSQYDTFGRLLSSTDGNGNVTRYGYGSDTIGRTVEVLHQTANGLVLSRTTYDAFDRVLRVTDANGHTTAYDYDDSLRALTVTTAEGVSVTTVSNNHGETYTVDGGEGYIDRYEYDVNGRLTSTTRIGENEQGQVVSTVEETNTYYSSGLLKETTDANGNRVVYYYDAAQRLVSKVTDPDGLALTTEYLYQANGKQLTERVWIDRATNNYVETVREFDRNGRLSHQFIRGLSEAEDIHTYFQYDDQGREILVSTGGTHQPTWGFDEETNEVRRVFLDGQNAVRYEYDALGRRIAEVRDPSYTDPVSGERLYQGLDLTTRYVYDANNNVIRSTAPNGAKTWFYYDDRNRQVFTINDVGEVTRSIYDDASNLVGTVEYASAISTFALTGGTDLNVIEQRLSSLPERDRQTQYLYDDNNRLVFSRDALGHVTESVYKTGTNQIIETRQYARSDIAFDSIVDVKAALAGTAYRSNRTFYDALGRVEFTIDPAGAVTQNRYDAGGRIVATIRYATLSQNGDVANYRDGIVGPVKNDPANKYTWYAYDGANRQTAQVDAQGFVTLSRYDDAGRVTRLREFNQSLFAGLNNDQLSDLKSTESASTLDSLLNTFVQSQVELQEQHVEQQVARLGNIAQGLAEANWTVVTQAPVYRDTLTTYDKAGRVSGITDAIGALKRSVAELAYVRGIVTEGAEGHTERYTYDAMGNRTSLTNKKGDTWYYQYDALGRLLQETTPAVQQTRVQGVAWQADFAGLSGVSSGSPNFATLLAQRGLELTTPDYLRFEAQLPEDPGSIEGGVPVPEGSAYIAATASGGLNQLDFSRTTGSSWQADFSVAGNQFSGEIGLKGHVSLNQGTSYAERSLMLRMNGADLSVSYIDAAGIEKSEAFDQLSVDGLSTPVQLEEGAVYRAVFSVTRSSVVTMGDPEEVTIYTVTRDEDGNEITTSSIVTVHAPETTTVANLNVLLLKQNGAGWDLVGSHVVEQDSDWVYISNEQDAFAQLQVQSAGIPTATGGMTIYQFARILPDARAGEWSDQNQTLTVTERVSTRYEYDSLGNLTKLVEAYGTQEQRETGFVYDRLGRQTTTIHPEVGIYDEEWDAQAGQGYHNNARLESTIRPREQTFYDEFGNETAHIDARGNHSYKLYDQGNRLVFEVDAEGYVTGYEYDAFGNVETLTRYAASVLTIDNDLPVVAGQQPIALNGRKALDYDQFVGYVATHLNVEPNDNRKITTDYDALGRKTAVVQHLENVVVRAEVGASVDDQLQSATLMSGFEYNAFGQVVREWQSDWMIQDGQLTTQDISTYHFYNELGQRIATVDPEKYLSTFQYDAEGNLVGQAEYAHQLTENNSDNNAIISEVELASLLKTEAGLAELLRDHQRITRPDQDQQITQDELSAIGYDRVMRYEYDALNRQTVVWQDYLIQDGVNASAGLDKDGNVDPFRSTLSVNRSYDLNDASVAQSRMEYDALGNLVKVTDANGSITYTYYDALGRVTAVVEPERLSQTQDSPEMLAVRHINKGQANAALEWRTPQLAGIEKVELRVIAYNAAVLPDSDSPSGITYSSDPDLAAGERPLSVNADGTTRVDVSDLGSDKYRFQVNYYRKGESEPYGLANGVIDVVTDHGTPSAGNIVSWVDVVKSGDSSQATLRFKGNLPQGVIVFVDGVDVSSGMNPEDPNHAIVLGNSLHRAFGLHSYQVIASGGDVVASGSYKIETGTVNDLQKLVTVTNQGTTTERYEAVFGLGEATYTAKGKITSQQRYNWDSSKPNWKGSNRFQYTMSGFEHLGAKDYEYKVRVTKSDAVGGTGKYTHTESGSASYMSRSDRTKSSKKYRDARLEALESLTLTASFENERITLLKGDGSEFSMDYLEFYNLYQNAASETEYSQADTIMLRYRLYQPSRELTNVDPSDPSLRTAQWREVELTRIGKGYYVIGRGAIPDGQYEYQVVHKTQAGVETHITQSLTGQETARMNLGQIDAQIDIDAGGYSVVAPLTEFRYDALGNRVGETRYAEGAQIGSYNIDGYKARLSVGNPESRETNDQERLWRFDANGKMRQYINAEGHSSYFSYDESGNLRKEWSELSYVTANEISTSRVQGTIYRYDRTGRQTDVITLRPFMANEQNDGNLSVQQLVYNGFGEVIQRRALTEAQWNAWQDAQREDATPGYEDPGYDETFEYDSAGRLVRSHQGGVDTVYFYDNRGRVTHEVRHSGTDWDHAQTLHTGTWDLSNDSLNWAGLFGALGGDSTLAVTRYRYDQNGRVVTAQRPEWSQEGVKLAPLMRQRLDRWGNVIETTTEAGAQVLAEMEYRYNQRNQQVATIQKPGQGQSVTWWAEVGNDELEERALPEIVSELYYDDLGRQVATKDANGNLRAMFYDAGGNEVRSVDGEGYHEYQSFDALGNLREKTNALGHSQFYVYDKENRLTHHFTAAGGETRYTYDSAGNRNVIQQRIADDESNDNWITTRQVFDTLGNLIQSNTGGLYRTYAYDQYGNKVYERRGGQLQSGAATSDAVAATWTYDAYGRMTAQTDFGGVAITYDYDKAGQLRDKNSGSRSQGTTQVAHTVQYDYYGNGLFQGQRVVDGLGALMTGQRLAQSAYQYDALGRQVMETLTYSDNVVTISNTYDGFGRLRTAQNTATATTWDDYAISLEYGYDAVGNRRYVKETSGNNQDVSENWYTYDRQNRIVKSQFAVEAISGSSNLRLVKPTGDDVSAFDIEYDAFGNRLSMKRHTDGKTYLESYGYDADNRHELSTIGGDDAASGSTVNRKAYDRAGRMLMQESNRYSEDHYDNPQATLYRTYYYYNDRNQQAKIVTMNAESTLDQEGAENVSLGNTENTASSVVVNNYNTDGTLRSYINRFRSGSDDIRFTYAYSYAWFDDAKTARIEGTGTGGGNQYENGRTQETYDVQGNTIQINDLRGDTNDRTLTVNAQGQIIRQQWGGQGEGDSKNDYYFYSNGRTVGESHVTVDTTMRRVKLDGNLTSENLRNGRLAGFKYIKVPDVTRDVKTDIDANFTSIGNQYPAAQPSTYTVQAAGETLESIALSLWGDSSLWYLLADANGLSRNSALASGQALKVPNTVTNLRNAADTFKPYNPGEIIGNTLPEIPVAPPAQADAGCGAAQILVVVVAVVASVLTAGAAMTALGPILAGALGGAVGSIASQATGMALGIQQGFSWSAVAKGAIIGGITGGVADKLGVNGLAEQGSLGRRTLEALADSGPSWSSMGAVAANAAISYGVDYSVNRLFGDKPRFSWASVAGAAVGATAGAAFGTTSFGESLNDIPVFGSTVTGMAQSLLAREVERPHARHGVTSTEMIAANSFGSAIGNSVAAKIQKTDTFNIFVQNLNDFVHGGGGYSPNSVMGPNDGPQIPADILAARNAMPAGAIPTGDSAAFTFGIGMPADVSYTTSETLYDVNDPYFAAHAGGGKSGLSLEENILRGGLDYSREAAGDPETLLKLRIAAAREWAASRSTGQASNWKEDPAKIYADSVMISSDDKLAEHFGLMDGIQSQYEQAVAKYAGDGYDFVPSNGPLGFSQRSYEQLRLDAAARAETAFAEEYTRFNSQYGGLENTSIIEDVLLPGLQAAKWLAKASWSAAMAIGSGVEQQIVYRALTQADVAALESGVGLAAKAPNGTWTAAEHVANAGPGAGGAAVNSPWISTTRNLEVAKAYDSGYGIVAIDLKKVDSLQVEVWKTAPRVNGVEGLPYHRSIWAEEVTIYQSIPLNAIIGPAK